MHVSDVTCFDIRNFMAVYVDDNMVASNIKHHWSQQTYQKGGHWIWHNDDETIMTNEICFSIRMLHDTDSTDSKYITS